MAMSSNPRFAKMDSKGKPKTKKAPKLTRGSGDGDPASSGNTGPVLVVGPPKG
jgi:hypothetical protein